MEHDIARAGGQPPWHMWGTTNTLTLQTNNIVVSQQLARINYRRPDTWSFLFTLSGTCASGSSPGLEVQANFNLIIGIGRSQVTIPSFCSLVAPIPVLGGSIPLVWSTVAPTSGLLVAGPTATQEIISEFPAQEIQVSVSSQLPVGAVVGPPPFVIEVGAFFAPKTHIRPSWYSREYDGDEKGR